MLGLSINPYVQLVLQFRGWAWAQQLHPGKQQHVTETGTTLNPQKPWVQYEIQTKPEAPKTLFKKYYATYKIYISSHTSHYCYYYYYYYYYMSFKLLNKTY